MIVVKARLTNRSSQPLAAVLKAEG